MKNVTIKALPFACLVSLLFACNEKKTSVDKEQVKKEIQAREDEFAAVFNSGVLKNIGYYADDAISFFPNTAPLVGKPAIIEFLQADLPSNANKITFKTNEVYPSNDGNMVLEIGYFKVVDSANNPVNSGNYMSLFQKKDGKYVVLRDMSASDGVRVQ
ncbi:MAG TPA: nuclear transport factor 2 family protein [Chitinophagaceae bacterium]|jgi:ketosteroid isomerase-like protein|nr:nuclear transport factor 2 family protein [Chitinophagaceae bacterium]